MLVFNDKCHATGLFTDFASCFVDQSHGFRGKIKRTVPVIDDNVEQTFTILASSTSERFYISMVVALMTFSIV